MSVAVHRRKGYEQPTLLATHKFGCGVTNSPATERIRRFLHEKLTNGDYKKVQDRTGLTYDRVRDEIGGRARLTMDVLLAGVALLGLIEKLYIALALVGHWGLTASVSSESLGPLPRVLREPQEESE